MNEMITAIAVQVDGVWRNAEELGITLQIEELGGDVPAYRSVFQNTTGHTIRLGGFRFTLSVYAGIPGPRIRIYREGWTMASAAASVRYGECDFEVDPNYLAFAVSHPEDYSSAIPNRFTAEHVVVLNDKDTGQSLLAGFISSADQFGRFTIELNERGINSFVAYSSADGIVVEAGQKIASEELIFLEGADGYGLLEDFAALWGKRMQALLWTHIPTGWCSWYYYFDKVTQEDVYENAAYLQVHREEFPVEYLQLDDGYQSALGDWLIPNEKFSDGLAVLAEKVRACGLKPGIWLAPFMVEERSRLFTEHPDWMIHDENGSVIWTTIWRGSRVAVLDGTNPQAQKYLTHVFATLKQWGYDYVKIDFLVYACQGKGGCYYDKSATRAQALRQGVEAIRKGMGDGFILGCTTPLGPVVGLVNGERIGTDITPYWQPDRKIYKEAPTVPNVCRNIINRSYMNGRLWISDPDVHIARTDNNKLTENEVDLWTNALRMVGGMLLFADRFGTLTSERSALSKTLLSSHGPNQARPLDLFEREYPAIWMSNDLLSKRTLICVFNFGDLTYNFNSTLAHYLLKTSVELKECTFANTNIGNERLTISPHSSYMVRLN